MGSSRDQYWQYNKLWYQSWPKISPKLKFHWPNNGYNRPGSRLWQKSGKFHFWMSTAPGANMLSTHFWLIIVLLVLVKTYRSLKMKFFVKVKNKDRVTIGNVCDFARNWFLHQNDFKVKNLWCVMEFLLSNTQMMDNIFTNNFMYFVWNSIVRITFDAVFCLVTLQTFWCNVLVMFVTFVI